MGPNAAWMRTHERCTFEWIGGQGCGTKLRPSNDIRLTSEHEFGFYDSQGMDHRFGSMEMIEGCLRHDCVFKGSAIEPGDVLSVITDDDMEAILGITLKVGDQLAAFDDATVGRPRPGAPICGVVVGRDGPHVVVACRGSKLSFVVADGLSVEGLPQIEKPETKAERLTWLELPPDPTPPIGEDIATLAAGTFSNLMGKPLDIGSAIWRALGPLTEAEIFAAPLGEWRARDWAAYNKAHAPLSVGYSRPTIHGPLTEAEIFAAQLANDAEREAPALFPDWSRAPRSQSQAIGAGLGVWGTRDAKPAVEAKPYPQIDETDLLPDA